MFGLARKLYMVTRSFLENYRANAGYEFYENYGLNLVILSPWVIIGNFHLSIAIKINRMMKNYPLFGARHDQVESLRFNMLKPMGACWSLNLGLIFNDSRSTISIYKRRANNFSAQINYQCFK